MPNELVPITLFIVAGFVLTFSPVGKAMARSFTRGKPDEDEAEALRGEIAELRAELDEMRGLKHEVAELQERLDFAERLLAQVKSQGLLK